MQKLVDNISFYDGDTIGLTDMLLAREKRVQLQHFFLDKLPSPVLSFSLVLPGPYKQSSGAKSLFKIGLEQIEQCLYDNSLPINKKTVLEQKTGYEAILSIDCDALQLKQHMIILEQTHSLGRFWDIDIIDPKSRDPISRQLLFQPIRYCILCNNPAKVCARSRQHSVDDILQFMQVTLMTYLDNQIGNN